MSLSLTQWGTELEVARVVSIAAESVDPEVIKVVYDVDQIQYIDLATVEAERQKCFGVLTNLTALKTVIIETANPTLEITNAKLIQIVGALSPETQAEIAALPEFQAIIANT